MTIKSEPGQTSKNLNSNNVSYTKRTVLGLNRFSSGHFQNTPNIKTFFGYAVQNSNHRTDRHMI